MTAGSSLSYERVINLMLDGIPVKEIAQREGMNEIATRRLVAKLAEDHKIDYQPSTKPIHAYGTTKESLYLRLECAVRLSNLREKVGGNRSEIARLIGLNIREQIRAEERPYLHDWTLSQLERLAATNGDTLCQLIKSATTSFGIGN